MTERIGEFLYDGSEVSSCVFMRVLCRPYGSQSVYWVTGTVVLLLARAIFRLPARVNHGVADHLKLGHLLRRRHGGLLPRSSIASMIGRLSGLLERVEEAVLCCPCLFLHRHCRSVSSAEGLEHSA